MNVEACYLADPYAEIPTYIKFFELQFVPEYIEVYLKTTKDEYLQTGKTVMVWRSTGKKIPIYPDNPPLLDNCPLERQLLQNNGEEILTLFNEALMQGAYEEIEENVLGITLYDYRKANNVPDTKLRPINRWVVFTGDNLPDFAQSFLSKFYEVIVR